MSKGARSEIRVWNMRCACSVSAPVFHGGPAWTDGIYFRHRYEYDRGGKILFEGGEARNSEIYFATLRPTVRKAVHQEHKKAAFLPFRLCP